MIRRTVSGVVHASAMFVVFFASGSHLSAQSTVDSALPRQFVGEVIKLHPTKSFAMVKGLSGIVARQMVCFYETAAGQQENLGGDVIDSAAMSDGRLIEIGCGTVSLVKGSRTLVKVDEGLKKKIKKGMRAEALEIETISNEERRRARASKRRTNQQSRREANEVQPKRPGRFAFVVEAGLGARGYANPGLQGSQKGFLAYGELAPFLSFQSLDRSHNLAIMPRYRFDAVDDNHTRGDIGLLEYSYLHAPFELTAGISQVRFGSAYSGAEIVDIINQRDYAHDVEGSERLGQPMVRASYVGEVVGFEAYLMPFPRERIYPGAEGRTRPPVTIFSRNSQFESSAKKNHVDVATRLLFNAVANLDVGLSYFKGTSRQPVFLEARTDTDRPVLIPLYEQMGQLGLEVQASFGTMIGRAEAASRNSRSEDVHAFLLGGEMFFNPQMSLFAEYMQDSRGDEADSLFQRDVLVGLRYMNPYALVSQATLKQYVDVIHGSLTTRLQGEFSLTSNYALAIDLFAIALSDSNSDDYAALLRRDSYLALEFKARF